ncbi:hypothetical protein E4656_05140 [Natronospirillum operosum]|uniref:Uncharacterized protein n=1 Tax=Natronospirillum operosum TaxID=2759953 RepID=A0A4Z0WKN6_9GAMM|nr:hypothetical protein [Natronospirillum operosum]TGG95795.1 hypothetical protein E4656_05140 [Natronospirillum operosum]
MKDNEPLGLGFGQVPFPQGRRTREQIEEDHFMEFHGSNYCRLCHWIMKVIRASGKAFRGMMCRLDHALRQERSE